MFQWSSFTVTIHSPSTLHSQSRPLRVLSRSYGAKIAHLVEVPASQSNEKQSFIRLHASMTRLNVCFSLTVNSNVLCCYFMENGACNKGRNAL